MISLIFWVISTPTVAWVVFLSLLASSLQLIFNFLVANILLIVLISCCLFALLIILGVFLPESKKAENQVEKEDAIVNVESAYKWVEIPELKRLILSQSQTTIKSGETIQFELSALDQFDNQVEINDRISWSATAGKIDSSGLFSIDSVDDVLVTVMAEVGSLEATAIVNVESAYKWIEIPELKYLQIIPHFVYLKPDEEQVFKAIGYDQYNDQMDCGEIIWSATGGTIDQNGKLIVSNRAKGIYQITATSKHTPKHSILAKTTLLTLGLSTRILSWTVANEEFFHEFIAPLLGSESNDDSVSGQDVLVQEWKLEIGRRRVAKFLKKASNLFFEEAFSKISDCIDYIVVPELKRIKFVNPPSNVKQDNCVQLNVIGLDQVGDRLEIEDQIIWTASSGKIDSQGIFIINNNTGSVEISAKVQGTNITTRIKIKIEVNFKKYTESVKLEPLKNPSSSRETITSNGLTIYSPRFLIQAGESKKFKIITGFNSQECPIEYQGDSVIWEATAGKIDSEGVLKTPIAFKDQYIEVSAKVNDIVLYYSFHTTGTHKYVIFNEYGYLPHISEEIDKLISGELFDLIDEYYELIIERLKTFEVDTSSKQELFEDIIDYLIFHQNACDRMMLNDVI